MKWSRSCRWLTVLTFGLAILNPLCSAVITSSALVDAVSQDLSITNSVITDCRISIIEFPCLESGASFVITEPQLVPCRVLWSFALEEPSSCFLQRSVPCSCHLSPIQLQQTIKNMSALIFNCVVTCVSLSLFPGCAWPHRPITARKRTVGTMAAGGYKLLQRLLQSLLQRLRLLYYSKVIVFTLVSWRTPRKKKDPFHRQISHRRRGG